VSPKDGWRELFRGLVFDNFGLKVLSLLVALGFYAFIHGAENARRTLAVPVVAIQPPETTRQLMTQLPPEVAVTVRGSRTQLDDLRADDLGSLRLDLTGHESRVELAPTMFHVPPGVTVEQIYPSAIPLKWDEVVLRQIRVQVLRTGEPAHGLSVKAPPTVEPAVVTARGPRSAVETLSVVRTALFDVTGLPEGVHRKKLRLEEPPKLVSFDTESVDATIEIVREVVTNKVPNLKVEVVGAPRATTRPVVVTVFVTGTAEDVNSIAADALVPRVEPKTAGADLTKPGSAYLDVVVDVPRGKARVDPPKVLVKW
jgi:YbbR domain-containing protein